MKVKVGSVAKNYHTVWIDGSVVKMINQPLLPHEFQIVELNSYKETARAIKNMTVRGAPAIGATGALGMAQAALSFFGKDIKGFRIHMQKAKETLTNTRPTAYDLFHAVDTVHSFISGVENVAVAKRAAVAQADQYIKWSVNNCAKIGHYGNKLIKNGYSVLTHCNAGALACVDYGTALSPIRAAHAMGKNIHVFVDETRPRCQGARLTAWEMANEGILHHLIADNAAGHFMQNGKINIVIVGADRVAANGDIANKIGTYEKAVLAKVNKIPFYVAAPSSTIDFECKSGKSIPIEKRSGSEVLKMFGLAPSGKVEKISIAPGETPAYNPAFDVTPRKYITGIITERGVFKPSRLNKLKRKKK